MKPGLNHLLSNFVARTTYTVRRGPFIQTEGQARVRISELVYPLRVDIAVRRRMFQDLRSLMGELKGDDLVLRFVNHDYFYWYWTVACHSFLPAGVNNPQVTIQGFRGRLAASMKLLKSWEAKGLDLETNPIQLHAPLQLLQRSRDGDSRTAIYAGDGCHRLALLWMQGEEWVEPHWYVVRRYLRFTPLNNTARLLCGDAGAMDAYLESLDDPFLGRAQYLEELRSTVVREGDETLQRFRSIRAAVIQHVRATRNS